jgi:hypothetical protein
MRRLLALALTAAIAGCAGGGDQDLTPADGGDSHDAATTGGRLAMTAEGTTGEGTTGSARKGSSGSTGEATTGGFRTGGGSSGSSGSGTTGSAGGTTGSAEPPAPVCPGVGAYCGDDGVTNGQANTLYECPGSGEGPSSFQPCGLGCQVEPAGTPDYCKGSCPAVAQAALSWEANVIHAGQAGNCNPNPPACYDDYCMQFVGDAYQYGAGVSIPRAGTAADDIQNFRNQGAWNGWYAGAVPPCGAIIVWSGNGCNFDDGHIVISNGDGTASTSGWSGFAGSTNASLSWLSSVECAQPAGWANVP